MLPSLKSICLILEMGNKRCSGIIKMLFLCLFSLLQRSNLVKFAQLNLQRLDLGYFQQETAPQRIFRNAAVWGGLSSAPSRKPLVTRAWPLNSSPVLLCALYKCFIFAEKYKIIHDQSRSCCCLSLALPSAHPATCLHFQDDFDSS